MSTTTEGAETIWVVIRREWSVADQLRRAYQTPWLHASNAEEAWQRAWEFMHEQQAAELACRHRDYTSVYFGARRRAIQLFRDSHPRFVARRFRITLTATPVPKSGMANTDETREDALRRIVAALNDAIALHARETRRLVLTAQSDALTAPPEIGEPGDAPSVQ